MSISKKTYSRRKFIANTSCLVLGATLKVKGAEMPEVKKEPIIDIHQHIHYHERTDEQMLFHQMEMGIATSILLPAGRPVNSASTHNGISNGLQAEAGENAECYLFAQKHSKEFLFGANNVPDLPDAIPEIEKYLKLGAVVIGELKFGIECDSTEMQKIYQLAQAYKVPVLMHWQYQMYNYGFERFYKMLEKYPRVNFIGHAQTWHANLDKEHKDQSVLYPKGAIAKGGLTEAYLSNYPNMFGDLSAGSGLNALTRDEAFTRDYLNRHQNKLLFGSDCADMAGKGKDCDGSQIIEAVRRLAPTKEVERKLLYENAKKLFRL
ncbi:amidohydrolase family protein [Segetibacter koreensis]|uniref:amidohydrolase family protein n=1 Tax=Segetibacter koreensis TaxID=398037 RepID=UPI0003659399|nr:amidohydrolase family protein [Segetibacter koreensis]